ncbi:hypothetical protein BMW23_0750 [Bodo saltans virus]|uniref:Uncharacterized protein n=1 Tax=Bodo saltans virus TaxID=2024608 RepID=A0A2H4UVB3_9VIRU|nr:hypothetical protein QJ851_gp0733 [Bodo saltans virus]ATZ80796.1 hypothetical protein BMW23_0750 [Bodo saltans virus]
MSDVIYTESFNEGTFIKKYNDDNIKKNIKSSLYPLCTQNIKNNGLNERYCADFPFFKSSEERIFNNSKWSNIKYPSYFIPAYISTNIPNIVYAPNYFYIE